jgi:hypothetical protein
MASELLKFKDIEIEALIIQKLKKDKHWKYEKERFESQLGHFLVLK